MIVSFVPNARLGAIARSDDFALLRFAYVCKFPDEARRIPHLVQEEMFVAAGFVEVPERLARQVFRCEVILFFFESVCVYIVYFNIPSGKGRSTLPISEFSYASNDIRRAILGKR